jgi:hypothetical protein
MIARFSLSGINERYLNLNLNLKGANSVLKASLSAVSRVGAIRGLCRATNPLPRRSEPCTALHFPKIEILAADLAPGSSTMQQGGAPKGEQASTTWNKMKQDGQINPDLKNERIQQSLQGHKDVFKLPTSDAPEGDLCLHSMC